MKELEVDESDDVSALSMDGASAIAGMSFAKRILLLLSIGILYFLLYY